MMRDILFTLILIALLLTASGCDQSMGKNGRIKPLQEDSYFDDESSARIFPEDVIPRGFLKDGSPYFTGMEKDGNHTAQIPISLSRSVFALGQTNFNIYCSVCHGQTGFGDGGIVRRGFTKPPNYHSDELRNTPSGYFFHVMSEGAGDMASYRDVLDEYERWSIVAYIRALQRSQNAQLKDAPAPVQEELEKLKEKK
jgi:mono/diheme cytochrome c family protein